MTAEEAVCSRLPGWRSSVFLNPHLFLPLLTPLPPRMGREGGGSQCQVGPPLPNLGFCHAPPPARASVWRSHSALTRLAGSGSRKIGRALARRAAAGALLPERLWGLWILPRGGVGGPGAERPRWAHWCPEEPLTLCSLVTSGTADTFPPPARIGEGHLAHPQLRGGGDGSGAAAPEEPWATTGAQHGAASPPSSAEPASACRPPTARPLPPPSSLPPSRRWTRRM